MPEEKRNSLVVRRKTTWGKFVLSYGDEFDCIRLKVPKYKYMQLLRSGKIDFGPVLRTLDEVIADQVPEPEVPEEAPEEIEEADQVPTEEAPEPEVAEEAKPKEKAVLKKRGGGWFNVMVGNEKINKDGSIRRKDAIALAKKHNQ